MYSNSVRVVRFCGILHLFHPSSVIQKLHSRREADKTELLAPRSQPSWENSTSALLISPPATVVEATFRASAVSSGVSTPTLPLPVEWGHDLEGQRGSDRPVSGLEARWEGLRLLSSPSRCSALRAGVSLTEAHPCPQPNCRMWLRHFSLEAEAVKPVVPNVFPKELTLFASEYG